MPRAFRPLILAYHGIGSAPRTNDPHRLLASERSLRRHVDALLEWGYELVTFGEIARRIAAGDGHGAAAVTFDDGLASLSVLPTILDGRPLPSTVFAVPGWFGAAHPDLPGATCLEAAGIRALADAGIEIGSHSEHHVDLEAADYDTALGELTRSKAALEQLVQRPVTTAAYPYGRADDDARRACRDAGYEAACRTSGNGSWADPFNLPRQDMDDSSTTLGLRLKRDERYERLMQLPPVRLVRRAARASRSVRA